MVGGVVVIGMIGVVILWICARAWRLTRWAA
jgi:hypothetical protein